MDTDGNKHLTEIREELREIKGAILASTKEILTVEEAAKFLGLSIDSLNYYTPRNTPVIPYTWVGKHKRFLRNSLLKFIKERETRTPWQMMEDLKAMDKRNGKK